METLEAELKKARAKPTTTKPTSKGPPKCTDCASCAELKGKLADAAAAREVAETSLRAQLAQMQELALRPREELLVLRAALDDCKRDLVAARNDLTGARHDLTVAKAQLDVHERYAPRR